MRTALQTSFLIVLTGLLAPGSSAAQACLGEGPFHEGGLRILARYAGGQPGAGDYGVDFRAALPGAFVAGVGWTGADPPRHPPLSAVVAREMGSGQASLCPLVTASWSHEAEERPEGFVGSEGTSSILVTSVGAGYGIRIPVHERVTIAPFGRGELQRIRHRTRTGQFTPWSASETRTETSTELLARFGAVVSWNRWHGAAWMGMGTADGRPPHPHAAGDLVFGLSLGVSF